MTNSNYLTVTPEFIDFYLKPLSHVLDKAPFKIKNGVVETCFNSPIGGKLLVKYTMDVDTDIEDYICLGDVRKFKDLLTKATVLDEQDKVYLSGNKLKYTSSKWRFTYFLLDKEILVKKEIPDDKFDKFGSVASFTLTPESILNIVRLKTLHKNSSVKKIYFYIENGKLFACLTDETLPNTDELVTIVTEDVDHDGKHDKFVVNVETLQLFSQHKNLSFDIKFSEVAMLAQANWNGVKMNYLTSLLRK